MTGKPRPCTVRGRRLWYLDDRDPLTGKRKRVFFATKAEADAKQQEVNRRPKTQAVLHPLVTRTSRSVRLPPTGSGRTLWAAGGG